MIKGVTENEYSIIIDILKSYNAEFYAYGSRVKGGFSPLSDLDILIKSDNYDEIIFDLKEKFDQSNLSYVVNFTNFHSVEKNFYELIKDDLVRLM